MIQVLGALAVLGERRARRPPGRSGGHRRRPRARGAACGAGPRRRGAASRARRRRCDGRRRLGRALLHERPRVDRQLQRPSSCVTSRRRPPRPARPRAHVELQLGRGHRAAARTRHGRARAPPRRTCRTKPWPDDTAAWALPRLACYASADAGHEQAPRVPAEDHGVGQRRRVRLVRPGDGVPHARAPRRGARDLRGSARATRPVTSPCTSCAARCSRRWAARPTHEPGSRPAWRPRAKRATPTRRRELEAALAALAG